MKGVKRVIVDTGGAAEARDGIVSEIMGAKIDLGVSDRADDGDVILNFRASRNVFSGAHLAIGEVFVRQDRLRLVREFVESGRSEKAVARQYARAFVEAYKKDNQLR